jgi:hypothetical protein
MKTSTENINAINDLQPGESLEFNFEPMSEFGERKDVFGFLNYQINNEGAFMKKHALQMLQHFLHMGSGNPAVTLYTKGHGHVLDVNLLLQVHFGPDGILPAIEYFHDKLTELATPKAKAKGKTKAFDPIWDTI